MTNKKIIAGGDVHQVKGGTGITAGGDVIIGDISGQFAIGKIKQKQKKSPSDKELRDSLVKFTIITLKDGQMIRSEDLPLMIEGQYPSNVRVHIWVVLQDSYGNYYLQNPEIQFLPDKWVAMNVNPGKGIVFIHFVWVNDEGQAYFLQKVAKKEWDGFCKLPSESEILRSVRVTRV